MKPIPPSELILNKDDSIYHLNLRPEQLSDTVILVGDPGRVEKVSKFFDQITHTSEKREFKSATGVLNKKRITVLSTGIGPDNIDIAMNELDALANVDFNTKTIKEDLRSLEFIRIGTSGALQPEIPVDSFIIGTYGLGLNSTLHAYKCGTINNLSLSRAFVSHTQWHKNRAMPYAFSCDSDLLSKLKDPTIFTGITATADGFYGPQGRVIRLPLQDAHINEKIASFRYENTKITNFEMETAAIYGLAKLMGHRAISINAVIANRATGTFSKNAHHTIEKLIQYTLEKLTQS
ncbi:MAG: phosphorylase [Flavobacteriales bacterium]|nr:MAG: phosphorylase [Flavobacteriales bacterium]